MPSDVNFKCYAEGREGKTFVEILMHRQKEKTLFIHHFTQFITVTYLTQGIFTIVLGKSG